MNSELILTASGASIRREGDEGRIRRSTVLKVESSSGRLHGLGVGSAPQWSSDEVGGDVLDSMGSEDEITFV